MGKPLSIKILTTVPFLRPTRRPSLLGGPEIVFTYLMFESNIHSLSRTPEKERSYIFISKTNTRC